MDCERWRESVSALADGEESVLDARLIEAHVARCPGCREFRNELASRGTVALRPVGEQRDLSRAIATQVAAADRAGHPLWLRAALGASAVAIIAFGVPALVLGDSHGSSSHAARHLGAFTVAYGFGLLAVVLRPARARAFLPVAAVVAGGLAITAALDVASGTAPLVGELKHVLEIVSVGLVWALAPRPPRRPADVAPADGTGATIRLVEDDRRAG